MCGMSWYTMGSSQNNPKTNKPIVAPSLPPSLPPTPKPFRKIVAEGPGKPYEAILDQSWEGRVLPEGPEINITGVLPYLPSRTPILLPPPRHPAAFAIPHFFNRL